MEFLQKKQINSFLKKNISKEQPIVVWVSWWPDSMCLVTIIQEYWLSRWRSLDHINVAHFNHGQRKQSIKEHEFLQSYFPYNNFYRNTDIPSSWLWETELREKRHMFFEEVLVDSKSSILLLWHNLTDRIETTLLNMVRWAWVEWIRSIKPVWSKKDYLVLRPLLPLDKKTIQKICEENTIPYFLDKTNQDQSNPRNKIRNTIVPMLMETHPGGENNRHDSRQSLYESLWSSKQKNHRKEKTPHPLRWVSTRKTIKIKKLSYEQWKNLLGEDHYVTRKTLETLDDFIKNSKGHLFLWGRTIMKEWDHIHCFQWNKQFWKQKHSWSLVVKKAERESFYGQEIYASKDRIWATIRFPQEWDTYKWKRLLKVLLNKKIPVFKRNTTPLVVVDGVIVAIIS
jgi:tRNA(Ile)-lysidine synthetase-like protein